MNLIKENNYKMVDIRISFGKWYDYDLCPITTFEWVLFDDGEKIFLGCIWCGVAYAKYDKDNSIYSKNNILCNGKNGYNKPIKFMPIPKQRIEKCPKMAKKYVRKILSKIIYRINKNKEQDNG